VRVTNAHGVGAARRSVATVRVRAKAGGATTKRVTLVIRA
jgi:hypothetical protein